MKVLYVDDEVAAITRFQTLAARLGDIECIDAFTNANNAITFAEKNPVDIAFLDIEMPVMSGIELAKHLKELDVNIKIVFVTAFDNFALDAFGVDALGYLLKPYNSERLQKEIDKAKLVKNVPRKKLFIKTMPHFDIYINDTIFPITSTKPKELLALLVDRNGGSVTAGQAISCLWESRPDDDNTKALYRMTCKRLKETLASGGIDYILGTNGSQRYVKTDMFECDLSQLLTGNKEAKQNYNGEYMSEYWWAEETNGRLMRYL